MADIFQSLAVSLGDPAGNAFAITPSDATVFVQTSRALYVGIGGDITVEMAQGQEVTFAGLPDGALLPIRVVRVLAATTADHLIGLY